MILSFHIFVALTSLIATGLAFVSPSQIKLRVSYGTVALTLISGSYLVATRPAHLAQSCAVGLAYITISFVGILAARHKFEHSHVA
jgi:hypothetical protein